MEGAGLRVSGSEFSMIFENRQRLLNRLPFEDEPHVKLRGDPAGRSIRWKVVASFKPLEEGPTLEFGISEIGAWVVPSADGSLLDVDDEGDYLPLYPLLEMPLPNARTILEAEFARHGVDAEWMVEFPFHLIAASAMRSGSKFWPDGALEWASNLPFSREVEDALRFLGEQGRTQNQ